MGPCMKSNPVWKTCTSRVIQLTQRITSVSVYLGDQAQAVPLLRQEAPAQQQRPRNGAELRRRQVSRQQLPLATKRKVCISHLSCRGEGGGTSQFSSFKTAVEKVGDVSLAEG